MKFVRAVLKEQWGARGVETGLLPSRGRVQEVIASAQSLDDMAKGLQEAVAVFKLDDGRLVTSRDRD